MHSWSALAHRNLSGCGRLTTKENEMGIKRRRSGELLADLDKRIQNRRSDGLIRLPHDFHQMLPEVQRMMKEHGVFDLMLMPRGSVYIIKTKNSTFWVTRTLRARISPSRNDMVAGFTVQTTSTSKAWISQKHPDKTFIDRKVTLNDVFHIGGRRSRTSLVVAHGYLI